MTSSMTLLTRIPENSAATPGLWNREYSTIDQNFQTLETATASLVVNASGLSGILNAGLAPYSAVGDGSTNNAAALTLADSAATRGLALLPPGVYRVDSSLTLTATWWPLPGAIIRCASGATVYYNGDLASSATQFIDNSLNSLGGGVIFANNKAIRVYDPYWWGVAADGVTSDHSALAQMFRAIPAEVTVQSPIGTMNIASTVTISDKDGLSWKGVGRPVNLGSNGSAAELAWSGATGGVMVALDRCRFSSIENMRFIPGVAGVGIDADGYSSGHIGTQNYLWWLHFYATYSNLTFTPIRISNTVTNNQEYYDIGYCVFRSGSEGSTRAGGRGEPSNVTDAYSISAGSDVVSTGTNFTFTSADSGSWFRGALGGPGGSRLSTTIKRFIDAQHVQLAASAASSVVSKYFLVGCGTSTAIYIAASFNAKRQYVHHCNFHGYNSAIECAGGNMRSEHNSFSDCECNIPVAGSQSAQVEDNWSDTESSRQHCNHDTTQPFGVNYLRYATNFILPGGNPNAGFFQFGTQSYGVEFIKGTYDQQTLPSGSSLFDVNSANVIKFNEVQNDFGLLAPADVGLYPPTTAGKRGVIYHWLTGGSTELDTWGHVQVGNASRWIMTAPINGAPGSNLTPSYAFSSESSLGFYRSGASTVAMSYGTLNLATAGARLSMRTLAASAITVSAALTNVAVNEAVFTVGGASGASFGIMSGGTFYFFNSAGSAKAT